MLKNNILDPTCWECFIYFCDMYVLKNVQGTSTNQFMICLLLLLFPFKSHNGLINMSCFCDCVDLQND